MKHTILKMSAVLVPCLFALHAHGAAVDVKPIELKPIEVKPMEVKPVAPAATGSPIGAPKQGLDFGGLNDNVPQPTPAPPVTKADAPSCPVDAIKVLAKKSGFSETRVQQLKDKNIIRFAGDCGTELTELSEEADRHLVATADYAELNGIETAAEDQKNGIYAKGLDLAFQKDGVNLPFEDVTNRAIGVRTECGFWQ